MTKYHLNELNALLSRPFSRRAFMGGLALGAGALALGGCSNASQDANAAAGSSSGELTHVSFGSSLWPSCMFFRLAAEKGLDKQFGLDLEIQEFTSSTETNTAFVGGRIDFCNYASPEVIAPYSVGGDLMTILETDQSDGCEGIVSKPEITTVEDLRGKTIATQLYSADHMLLLTLLQDNGMSADDVNIVDMTIQESSNAFIAGQCDAASVWDPYFTEAREAGGNVLYSTADNPNLITDCLVTSSRMIKENPDAVQAMVNVYFAAIDWWKKNPEEGSEYMGNELGTDAAGFDSQIAGLHLPDAEAAVTAFTPADDYTYWAYTQNVIRDFMYDLGQIDNKPDFADMVDDTFVKAYAADQA